MDSLPSSFNQLGSLMELEIQINNSDTFDVKNRLSGLFNLKTLMIYKSNLKSFPIGLNENYKLKKILIVNSGLTQLDSSFAYMKNIQTLILDKNNFEEIPKEWLIKKLTLQ